MKYILIVFFSLVFIYLVKSQILYTNPEPDIIIYTPVNSTGDSTVYLEIDINQDVINDFQLFAKHAYQEVYPNGCWDTWNMVNPINMGQILNHPDGYPFNTVCMVPISQEDTINADGSWTSFPGFLNLNIVSQMIYCSQPYGNQYYGFRLIIEDHFYYGWLSIHSTLGVLVLHDMAINLTPDEFMIPGQITTETNFLTYNDSHLMIFPNPATSFITLTAPGDLPIEEAIIYNHLGQKVLTAKPVNNVVDVSGLKAGMYMIEVATKDWKERRKFFKK